MMSKFFWNQRRIELSASIKFVKRLCLGNLWWVVANGILSDCKQVILAVAWCFNVPSSLSHIVSVESCVTLSGFS